MSDAAMNRIIELIHQGYDVDISADEEKRYVQIKITKNRWNAKAIISYDELDQANVDAGLYTINRLVEKLNA